MAPAQWGHLYCLSSFSFSEWPFVSIHCVNVFIGVISWDIYQLLKKISFEKVTIMTVRTEAVQEAKRFMEIWREAKTDEGAIGVLFSWINLMRLEGGGEQEEHELQLLIESDKHELLAAIKGYGFVAETWLEDVVFLWVSGSLVPAGWVREKAWKLLDGLDRLHMAESAIGRLAKDRSDFEALFNEINKAIDFLMDYTSVFEPVIDKASAYIKARRKDQNLWEASDLEAHTLVIFRWIIEDCLPAWNVNEN